MNEYLPTDRWRTRTKVGEGAKVRGNPAQRFSKENKQTWTIIIFVVSIIIYLHTTQKISHKAQPSALELIHARRNTLSMPPWSLSITRITIYSRGRFDRTARAREKKTALSYDIFLSRRHSHSSRRAIVSNPDSSLRRLCIIRRIRTGVPVATLHFSFVCREKLLGHILLAISGVTWFG